MYVDIVRTIGTEEFGDPISLWHSAFGRIPRTQPWAGRREVSGEMVNENGIHCSTSLTGWTRQKGVCTYRYVYRGGGYRGQPQLWF